MNRIAAILHSDTNPNSWVVLYGEEGTANGFRKDRWDVMDLTITHNIDAHRQYTTLWTDHHIAHEAGATLSEVEVNSYMQNATTRRSLMEGTRSELLRKGFSHVNTEYCLALTCSLEEMQAFVQSAFEKGYIDDSFTIRETDRELLGLSTVEIVTIPNSLIIR